MIYITLGGNLVVFLVFLVFCFEVLFDVVFAFVGVGVTFKFLLIRFVYRVGFVTFLFFSSSFSPKSRLIAPASSASRKVRPA